MKTLRKGTVMKSKLGIAAFVCLCVLLTNAFLSYAQASLTIGNYSLVKSQRVTLYEYDYTYSAKVTNTGPAVADVQGSLTSLNPKTKVVDGNLSFGDVAAGSVKASLDTFTIRQDRRYAFDPSKLSWAISFTPIVENTPPIANAGPDWNVAIGNTINLDGSASSDPDGDPITYSWAFIAMPAGSAAVLLGPNTVITSFVADKKGLFEIQLIVNDGFVDSAPDTVTISTLNSKPVANAGPDQTTFAGQTVQLNGSASTDVDGNALTYAWSFLSRPGGSTATISNPTTVNPTFVADRFGTYVVQLIVNDGFVDSSPDTVVISTQNTPPVANAGPDQTTTVGATVNLNASASSDVDGNPLTFSWSFVSRPGGSTATISNPTTVNPTFVADRFGTYVVQLIVNDGFVDSAPDTVTITTTNTLPVANAGPDQTVQVGDLVQLDGSGSTDVDGNPLIYFWSFTSQPAGSGAVLSDPTEVKPTFIIDQPGDFVLQLIVNDGFVDSAPDTMTITTTNTAPVANAGPNQTVTVGFTVRLDGSGSTDVNGNPLTYFWSLIARPAGSAASLNDPTAVQPTFTADQPGDYVVQLIVNDGFVDSAPDTVTISTLNSKPVANAGPPQNMTIEHTVQLDGSASYDADGDSLTFTWALLSQPSGSASTLSDIHIVNPTFMPMVAGIYVAQLIVNDGTVNSNPATVVITVANRLIDIPDAIELALGQTIEFPVLIAPDPAPAGGVQVTLASSDTSLVQVLTPIVTIPEGSFQTTARIVAASAKKGLTTITAENSQYTPDVMRVGITTALNVLQTSSEFESAETDTMFVRLESAGAPFAALVNETISLQSSNTSCVAVPASTTVSAGQSIGSATLSYGGSATLPCTATVTASSTLFGTDTLPVTVGQSADLGNMTITDISAGDYRTGSGLQIQYRVTLATANHGGVKIQIVSSNPSVGMVAPERNHYWNSGRRDCDRQRPDLWRFLRAGCKGSNRNCESDRQNHKVPKCDC